jgi:hypothetical protein
MEKLAKFSKTERTSEVHALTKFRKYSFVLQLPLLGWAALAECTSTILRLSLRAHLYTHGTSGFKKHCLKEKFPKKHSPKGSTKQPQEANTF